METRTGCFRSSYFLIKKVIDGEGSLEEKLLRVCEELKKDVDYFDWVGFYLVDKTGENLILGPYIGRPTEHKKIKIGEGLCGLTAQKKKTYVAQDVSKEQKYLSCDPEVKSELVVPIFRGHDVVAELDIDSRKSEAFTRDDKAFLEDICSLVSKLFDLTN